MSFSSITKLPKVSELKAEFQKFILEMDHPCLMAQTVFSMDAVRIEVYSEMGSAETSARLLSDLTSYISDYDFDSNEFRSFLAVFPHEKMENESVFENKLWEQLQKLHDLDKERWDASVSFDPNHKDFSFSLAGRAFFIVGMHPQSSRFSRRSPYPALAFNLHWQFEKLREMGSFDLVRTRIRDRDVALQGSVNPMLEDFGKNSEARQYSGRKVGKNWKCPFLHKKID